LAPNSKQLKAALVLWLVTYLETGSMKQARAVPHAPPNAKSIILRRLKATGGLDARPSTGRRRRFTDAVCQAALKALSTHPRDQLTLGELLERVKGKVPLPANANVANFSKYLRKYVHTKGLYINTTSRATIFLLQQHDFKQRVAFCRRALRQHIDQALPNIVFIDETVIEEAPHPGGEHTCSGGLRVVRL